LLLTFGLALVIEGLLAVSYGSSGKPYNNPLPGGFNLGFMFMPYYRAWVLTASLAMCFGAWYAIERTSLGAILRAATDNRELVRTFGINVPRLMTLTYGMGVTLAALAGVLAAPMTQVSPMMGSGLVITVFAVVVIGGMGSILGSIQGLLSAPFGGGHLHHHGRRDPGQAQWPVRAAFLIRTCTTRTPCATPTKSLSPSCLPCWRWPPCSSIRSS
jgi:branched-subunit amino acid ABC-type transport system permease component